MTRRRGAERDERGRKGIEEFGAEFGWRLALGEMNETAENSKRRKNEAEKMDEEKTNELVTDVTLAKTDEKTTATARRRPNLLGFGGTNCYARMQLTRVGSVQLAWWPRGPTVGNGVCPCCRYSGCSHVDSVVRHCASKVCYLSRGKLTATRV